MSDISKETIVEIVEAMQTAKQAQDDLTVKNREAKEQAEKSADALKRLAGSAGTFMKTMTDASQGTGKYAQATTSAANAAGDLVGKFGPLGAAVGAVIKVFGGLVGASLKQNDALIKTYRDFSKVGVNYSTSMKDVLKDLQQFGVGVEEASKLTEMLNKVSPELAMLGNTAGAGQRKLGEVFNKTLGDTEARLMQLGYTTDDMREHSAQYLASESLNSRIRSKTSQQLNAETVTYMQTLSELSMLTGESRDALEKERRQQENDLRFQMYLNTLDDNARENARTMILGYAKVYGKDASDGMKSLLVNQGRVVDQFGATAYQLIGDKGVRGAMSTLNQTGDAAEATFHHLKDVAPRISQSFKTFSPTIATSNDALKALGLNIQTYRGAMMMEGKDRKTFEEMRQQVEQQATDDRLGAAASITQAEREVRNAFETLTYMVGTGAVASIKTLATVGNEFARIMAKVVSWFGCPDLTDAFTQINDLEDAARVQTEQTEKLNRLKKEEIEIQKEILANEEFVKSHPNAEGVKADIKDLRQKLQSNRTSQTSSQSNIDRAKEAATNPAMIEGRSAAPANYQRRNTDVGSSQLSELFAFGSDSGSLESFQRLNPAMQDKLISAAKELQGSGKKLKLNSAVRSSEKQKQLYDDYVSGKSKLPAALPGTSLHEKGLAVDIQNYDDAQVLEVLRRNGLVNPIAGDKPHFIMGARTGGVFSGPESGYNVELHGKEAIVPLASSQGMADEVTKHALTSSMSSNSTSTLSADMFMRRIADMLDARLTDVVDELRRSNYTQDKILSAAK